VNYYEILEISEKASQEVIHMAYKALCKKYHPDVYQGDKNYAEEQMKRINNAYITLSDEAKKKEYDDSLENMKQSKYNTYTERKQEHNVTNIDALIKRGFMSLEDGEWLKANSYFEQVLNQNAETAEAYLGKLMIELQIKTRECLKDCVLPFDDNKNYIRALRFADDSLRKFLVDIIQYINNQNYEMECNKTYLNACELLKHYEYVDVLENAIILFKKVYDYKDSPFKIKECEEKIRILKEKRKRTIKLACIIVPSVTILLTLTIVFVTTINNINKYNTALSLIEKEKHVEAIAILEKLNDYKNSQELLHETQYFYANKLLDEKKYEEAKEIYTKIVNYKDSKNLIKLCDDYIDETNYQNSLVLLNEQKFSKAYILLKDLALKDYKDSNELIKKYNNSYLQERFNITLKTTGIGSSVTFGAYEQDDNLENGKEPIEWIIINRNETSAMLISRKIIEYQVFDKNNSDSTWETSSLREYLNKDFFNVAFEDSEKIKIAETVVLPDSKKYSTSPDQGNKTIDKVYILSEKEYNKYKSTGINEFITSKHIFAKTRSEVDEWWLRSLSDRYSNEALTVEKSNYHDTIIYDYYKHLESGVRPVIWVKFDRVY
jgi:tetratricopeptide (TPR) repeat protein